MASANPPEASQHSYRIVIHEISDDYERILADYTVDGYVAAIGRHLPTHQVDHETLEAARSNSLWASPASSRTAWPSSLTSICRLAKCNQDYASVQRAMEGIDLTVEVIGCPTVCRHCWAQGIPYSTMPLADVAWVLEAVHAWCDATGLRFGAYPMHEVVAHPEAADLLRLFAHHDWRPGTFQPLVTTGVPLVLRDDWREVLAAAAEIGTTIVWVAFHGMAEEHDRQVARRGAFVETCQAVGRIREAGLGVGCNVFVTKANAMQARELAETLTGLGIEQSCWGLAAFYPHARSRRYERLRPELDDLLPLALDICRWSGFFHEQWANLEAYTEAGWVRHALSGDWPSDRDGLEVPLLLVCRPNLDLHAGRAGKYRERYGSLRNDGVEVSLRRGLARRRSYDELWFELDAIPPIAKLAARYGDAAGRRVHFNAESVRWLWLDRAQQAMRRRGRGARGAPERTDPHRAS